MTMNRRQWTFTGAGVLAAAAGAGWSAWQSPARAAAAVPSELWEQSFQQLDGSPLQLSRWKGQPLLLNFWATWCSPCVKEMPMLDAFARKNRAHGWAVVGLAVDEAAQIRKFLERVPVGFPIAIAGSSGLGLARTLGNQQGGLPFSVAFNRQHASIGVKTGALTEDLLHSWVQQVG